MTSKSSSSEAGSVRFSHLLKENFRRRIWSAALCTLLFFFLFPIMELLQTSYYLDPARLRGYSEEDAALRLLRAKAQIFKNFIGWVETNDPVLSVVLFCLAVVLGVSAFSWLHNTKKTDFYHSLPVSRDRLFHAANLNSVLIVGVPYLVMSMAAAMIAQTASGHTGCLTAALSGFLGHMAFFLLAYMTTVLAMMLTGNVFVGLMGANTFFFWGPCMVALISGLMASFFRTYYANGDRFALIEHRTSVFTWMMDFSADPVPALFRAGISFAAAAVLMVLCLLLYRRRPSEAAGKAMAFSKTEAPIRLMISVPIAVGAAVIIHEMMDSDLWAYFAIVCTLLIAGCVIEIIFRFDFRQLFKHWPELVVGVVLSVLFFAVFRYDLAGYDRYLPDREKVSSAGIVCSAVDDSWTYGREYQTAETEDGRVFVVEKAMDAALNTAQRMAYTDPGNALAIAEAGIRYTEEHKKDPREYDPLFDTAEEAAPSEGAYEPYTSQVLVAWHLTDGRDVIREYTLDLHEIRENMDRLHDDISYKEGVYPVFGMDPEELSGVNYSDVSGPNHIRFEDPSDMKALLSAYQREFGALTAETRRREMPVGSLQFKSREMQELVDRLRRQDSSIGILSDWLYYPVYPSFTDTLAILKKCGVRLNRALDPEGIDSIIINDNRSFGELSWEETQALRVSPLIVRDPAKIREILDAVVISTPNNGCENNLGPRYYGLDISVRLASGEEASDADTADISPWKDTADSLLAEATSGSWYDQGGSIDYYSYNLNFAADKIPGFVKEHFGIEETDLYLNTNRSY